MPEAIRPIHCAFFHGEDWYKCPKCGKSFEYYATQFGDGFRHIEKNLYEHTSDNCGQVLDMT